MRSTIRGAYGVRSPILPGDWRRRMGTKTDAHLWYDGSDYALPLCRKNIEHRQTVALAEGRPCSGCLVAAIRAAPDAPESGGNR